MATIYFKYSTGNDTTGNGTSGNPYKTLEKAYAVASTGDEIIMMSGAHTLTADMGGNLSGTKNLTIRSQDGNPRNTYFDGDNWTYTFQQVWGMTGTVTFKDIGFRRTKASSQLAYVSGSALNLIFDNIYFDEIQGNNSFSAIFFFAGSNVEFTVQNCTLNNIMDYNGTALSRMVPNDMNRTNMYNNTFYIQDTSFGAGGVNVFYGGSATNCVLDVQNNIFYFANNTGNLLFQSNFIDVELIFKNNIIYLAGSSSLSYTIGYLDTEYSPITDENNQYGVDPLFIDISVGDFRLQSTSPAINAGVII